jgi:hypothetical protein
VDDEQDDYLEKLASICIYAALAADLPPWLIRVKGWICYMCQILLAIERLIEIFCFLDEKGAWRAIFTNYNLRTLRRKNFFSTEYLIKQCTKQSTRIKMPHAVFTLLNIQNCVASRYYIVRMIYQLFPGDFFSLFSFLVAVPVTSNKDS